MFSHFRIKICFFAVVAFAAISSANVISDAADNLIYSAIYSGLIADGKTPNQASCLVDGFRQNHIADKLKSINIITNPEQLKRDIQPYVDAAEIKCYITEFIQTPIGIGVAIIVGLLLLAMACWLIRCICRC